MVHITILCVGKLKESYLREACGEYLKRLLPFCRARVVEVGEERLPDRPSPAQVGQTIQKEGDRLLAQIPEGSMVFALCIEGRLYSSEEFAQRLEEVPLSGVSDIVFVIGGSYGLDERIKQRADIRLSMSKMTFPHQLARVMLLEQVYRGYHIITGGKYHK